MAYVDGFLIAVPKDRIDEYKKVAEEAGAVWLEHGALSVTEAVADDVPYGELTSFPRAVHATDDETVVFSWILYESREARDQVNEKVMADPRMQGDMSEMPFDPKRLIFGGFTPLVELQRL
ncbi:MAG: DUF1428 domain-containing protein [Actinomycetota bacterium]|nr:DUF1428 domain-containing protein [Actinomycetota bacterium]